MISKLPKETKAAGANCPFCDGNEAKTPPEVYAIGPPERQPNTPGWSVRVVSNKFPALRLEGVDRQWGLEVGGFELAPRMPGFGAHEVVIESPDHYATLASHSQEQLDLVLKALVSRHRDLAGDNRMGYIQIFKNWGHLGGCFPGTHPPADHRPSPDTDGSCPKAKRPPKTIFAATGFVSTAT